MKNILSFLWGVVNASMWWALFVFDATPLIIPIALSSILIVLAFVTFALNHWDEW